MWPGQGRIERSNDGDEENDAEEKLQFDLTCGLRCKGAARAGECQHIMMRQDYAAVVKAGDDSAGRVRHQGVGGDVRPFSTRLGRALMGCKITKLPA